MQGNCSFVLSCYLAIDESPFNVRGLFVRLKNKMSCKLQIMINVQCCARQMNQCTSLESLLWRLCPNDLKIFVCHHYDQTLVALHQIFAHLVQQFWSNVQKTTYFWEFSRFCIGGFFGATSIYIFAYQVIHWHAFWPQLFWVGHRSSLAAIAHFRKYFGAYKLNATQDLICNCPLCSL